MFEPRDACAGGGKDSEPAGRLDMYKGHRMLPLFQQGEVREYGVIHTYVDMHTCVHAHIPYTHMRAHVRTHTHARIHAHTHTRAHRGGSHGRRGAVAN